MASTSKKADKAIDPLKLAGMKAVIDDACLAAVSNSSGPVAPTNHAAFVKRLKAVQGKFPPVYEQYYVQSYFKTIVDLGPTIRAFQAFISDLYDGFLSAAERRGVKQPDLGGIPPLAYRCVGVIRGAAVVNMPWPMPSMAWAKACRTTGLVAYVRGLGKAYGQPARLGCIGDDDAPHPADIVQGYLAAEVVALLSFAGHTAWSGLMAFDRR